MGIILRARELTEMHLKQISQPKITTDSLGLQTPRPQGVLLAEGDRGGKAGVIASVGGPLPGGLSSITVTMSQPEFNM